MKLRSWWSRVQEQPLELVVALVAAFTGAANMTGRLGTLSGFAVMLYLTLVLGGIAGVMGRLRDNLPIESIGLVLLLGGFAFSCLRSLGRAEDAVDITRVVLNGGALVIGLAVRLYVVRKAFRARTRATVVLEGRRG